jgi:uncharacterized membrane protein
MSETSIGLMKAALWLASILILFALGIVVVRRWRGDAAEDQQDTSQMLTKFRELHLQGGLSDDEYRTIKTKLATQNEPKLNDAEDST